MPLTSPVAADVWKQAIANEGYTFIALGNKGGVVRMFVYAAASDGSEACGEVVATQTELVCTVKSPNAEFAAEFALNLQSCLL